MNYQWQYITPRPYLHRRLNHTRIQLRIYSRIRIRLRRLAPPQFSTQTARYLLPTHILLRLLQFPYFPTLSRLL